MTICASGVTISNASSTRLTARTPARTAFRTGSTRKTPLRRRLLHRLDLRDVVLPLREILVHLREHRLLECAQVEPVLLLDEHHPLGLEVLAVLGGRLAIPVERLAAHLGHHVLHDLAIGGGNRLVDTL